MKLCDVCIWCCCRRFCHLHRNTPRPSIACAIIAATLLPLPQQQQQRRSNVCNIFRVLASGYGYPISPANVRNRRRTNEMPSLATRVAHNFIANAPGDGNKRMCVRVCAKACIHSGNAIAKRVRSCTSMHMHYFHAFSTLHTTSCCSLCLQIAQSIRPQNRRVFELVEFMKLQKHCNGIMFIQSVRVSFAECHCINMNT